MSTDWAFSYLGGSIAAMLSHPAGWAMFTPAGWALTRTLVERGARP